MTSEALPTKPCMVVIPCLNEAIYIAPLIDDLLPSVERHDMQIMVVDGGSTDGTRAIVSDIAAANPRVHLVHNEKMLQSAGVNLVVEQFGDEFASMIRVDAHSAYKEDFCDRLLEEAELTGADSVVVSVITLGFGAFQKATAIAQNSALGNGRSPHRHGAKGRWIDHGHHAFMRVAPFRAVGGYDETFVANEDAEFDARLRAAGYRIWMTDKAVTTYFPRASVPALFRQYVRYGRGRARNILKHRTAPKVRQMFPLLVAPAVAGTSLALLNWAALIPAGLWVAACLGYGAWMAIGRRNPYGPLVAVAAMVMHLAWSAGFWLQILDPRNREARA